MLKDKLLETYWIESPGAPVWGFGVSAYSLEDAVYLLGQAGYPIDISTPGTKIKEKVTFSDLDQGHVVPNMGPIVLRGVWFPCANLG